MSSYAYLATLTKGNIKMKEILEENMRARNLAIEWMGLAIKHSAAMRAVADDRNEIAGKCYEARKQLFASLVSVSEMVRRAMGPTEAEADADTLQICALQGLQVND